MFYQLDRIRQTFAAQFEQDGSRLVFRKNLKAAPVEVTPAERDFLLQQFNRHLLWLGILTGLLTILVIVGVALITFKLNADFSQPLAFLCVALILAPVMGASVWAWNAPNRLIAGRASVPDLARPSSDR